MNPMPSIRSALPSLQRNGFDAFPFDFLDDFHESFTQAGSHFGGSLPGAGYASPVPGAGISFALFSLQRNPWRPGSGLTHHLTVHFLPEWCIKQPVGSLSAKESQGTDLDSLATISLPPLAGFCSLFSSAELAQLVARQAENAELCLIRDTSGGLSRGYAVSEGGRSRSLVGPPRKRTRGLIARAVKPRVLHLRP